MCTDLSGSNSISVVGAARTDYAVNGGSNYFAYTNFTMPTTVPPSANFAWPNNLPPSIFNGISYMHSQVTDAQLHRGQSSTYMLGEKYMNADQYDGSDPGDLYSAYSGDDLSLIRWGNSGATGVANKCIPGMDRMSYNSPPMNASRCFGSAHSAGWTVAFCDGQVRMLSFNIDSATHQILADRTNNTPIDPTNLR
jgi:hypothetical protein